jgi:hypothetical protein
MRARCNDAHRMTLNHRFIAWLLGAVERWGIPLLPRGTRRNQLRERIDRAQARLHSRVHDHGVQR